MRSSAQVDVAGDLTRDARADTEDCDRVGPRADLDERVEHLLPDRSEPGRREAGDVERRACDGRGLALGGRQEHEHPMTLSCGRTGAVRTARLSARMSWPDGRVEPSGSPRNVRAPQGRVVGNTHPG